MIEKIKTNVDRLLLVLIKEKKFPIYFAKIKLFFIFETKRSLSLSIKRRHTRSIINGEYLLLIAKGSIIYN